MDTVCLSRVAACCERVFKDCKVTITTAQKCGRFSSFFQFLILKVRFFKKSAKEKGRFLQLQHDSGKKPKTLIRGCETRWSGTHDMLARYYLYLFYLISFY